MQKDLIIARSRIVQLVRRYFDEQGFLEVHTPRLVGLPGQEPYLEPLWTKVHEQTGREHAAALITSPEYSMKRLLAAGFDKIYDLGPCFRDGEPWDGTHDPEFLMIEWYEKGIGLEQLMDRTEEMVKRVAAAVIPTNVTAVATASDEAEGSLRWDPSVSLGLIQRPFRRLTVTQAMKQYTNLDLDPLIGDRKALAKVAGEHGQTANETDTWDDLFFKIFLSEVEPELGRSTPTFLTHYPVSMAALARKDPKDPRYALRVELYAGDLELANGFEELSDPLEQRQRFEAEQALRRSLGKQVWPIDERFMEALPKIGQASGIAFGVDRLAMLLTGCKSISDLMPIPVKDRF